MTIQAIQSWFGEGSATSQSGDLGFLGLSLVAGVEYQGNELSGRAWSSPSPTR
jgi:hypothetical protein